MEFEFSPRDRNLLERLVHAIEKLARNPPTISNIHADDDPRCPKCGGKMVRRTSSHGEFWGCLKFPKCDGTEKVEG